MSRLKILSLGGVLLLLVSLLAQVTAAQPRLEKVAYLVDTIAEQKEDHITLSGGSVWLLSSSSTHSLSDEIIIVFRKVQLADGKAVILSTAYIDGDAVIAKHVSGEYAMTGGYFTRVVEVFAMAQFFA